MTKKEWIIRALQEYDYDVDYVLSNEMYDRFVDETSSHAFYMSYYKDVRKYYNELVKSDNFDFEQPEDVITEENKKEYDKYDSDNLIQLLEDEIKKRNGPIHYDDIKKIAVDNNIPFRAFIYQIPDLKNILKKLYQINLFHIENDKEIDKVKHENKKMKKEINYYKEKDVLDEKLIDVLDKAIEEYEPFKFNPPRVNKNNFNKDSEAVALLSDFHWDELVNYEQMLGINEYSIDIAKKRISRLFKSITENSQVFGVTTINLILLGDMISGELHDLAENNEIGIIKSIFQLADYIAQHIRNLGKSFDKINMLGLVGNHTRTHVKPRYKNKQIENYEYILYEFIKREVKNIAEFDLPESYMRLHEIQGQKFLSLHGDIIKGGNGLNDIPGNLSRDISLLGGTLGKRGKQFDYVNMAHFHTSNQTKSFHGAEIIMNGSLIGPNEFSLGAMKKGEDAMQTWYLVEKNVGVRFIDKIRLK